VCCTTSALLATAPSGAAPTFALSRQRLQFRPRHPIQCHEQMQRTKEVTFDFDFLSLM
jgi:hypothetical protein